MALNITKKIPPRFIFLFSVLLLYFVIFVLNPENGKQISEFFIQLAKKIIPLLLFVFFVMALVNKFLTEEVIKKHLGESRGLKGFLYTTVAGILISGPPYILYPMLADLKKKGVTNFHLAVFLYNRNIKISFMPALIFYFGFIYSFVLSFYIVLFSYFNGLLLEILSRKRNP